MASMVIIVMQSHDSMNKEAEKYAQLHMAMCSCTRALSVLLRQWTHVCKGTEELGEGKHPSSVRGCSNYHSRNLEQEAA